MNYHSIPSKTLKPSKDNVAKFLSLIDEIKKNGGKVHIHCKAGSDRTGMYAFIYKILNNLGTIAENKAEWIKLGHNANKFPKLSQWAEDLVKSLKNEHIPH